MLYAHRFAALGLGLAMLGGCATHAGYVPNTSPGSGAPTALQPLVARPHLGANAGVGVRTRAVCGDVPRGYARCFAVYRTDVAPTPDFTRLYETACGTGVAVCYGPADLQAAYQFPTTGGNGQTVAVVDAYDDPTAETDLAAYRSRFGLPPCTTANGCFLKVAGNDSTKKFPRSDSGWIGEESLDVDMVSAVCPSCKIVLVEALNNLTGRLEQAENTAVKRHATVISNSFGADEYAARSSAYDHPGIAITASAGDNGFDGCASIDGCIGPQDPAAFGSVIAVGGTTLMPAPSTTRGWTETTWNCFTTTTGSCKTGATGSGCSFKAPKPVWQRIPGCRSRAYNDVSVVADPVTGVLVYESGNWTVFGGTSAGSPIIAAAIALAGNSRTRHGAKEIWRSHGRGFNDIATGNNIIPAAYVVGGFFRRTCAKAWSFICTARVGYDGPTGWGTPNGVAGL